MSYFFASSTLLARTMLLRTHHHSHLSLYKLCTAVTGFLRVNQGGLISPVLFNLYVNDIPLLSHHVELALRADDTAIIATSRKLLVSYPDSHLDLQLWLREWRIAINFSKRTPIIFARAGRRLIQTSTSNTLWEPIELVDTTHYLGVTLDTGLTWSSHIDRFRNRTAQSLGTLGPFLKRKSDLSVRNAVLLYKQPNRPMMEYACQAWKSSARSHVRRI